MPPKPMDAVERFWRMVEKTDECWNWTGWIGRNGYGQIRPGTSGKSVLVHRFSYELHVGEIPEGLTIDHLCSNRRCVNPAHLEAVTLRVNVLRARDGITAINARKTHCIHGHGFTPENTYRAPGDNKRHCRACRRATQSRYLERMGGDQ